MVDTGGRRYARRAQMEVRVCVIGGIRVRCVQSPLPGSAVCFLHGRGSMRNDAGDRLRLETSQPRPRRRATIDATATPPRKDDLEPARQIGSAGKTIAVLGHRHVRRTAAAGAGQGRGSRAKGVTLNLVDVPTAQAAKTVLGDMLGVRYTVDPAVKGRDHDPDAQPGQQGGDPGPVPGGASRQRRGARRHQGPAADCAGGPGGCGRPIYRRGHSGRQREGSGRACTLCSSSTSRAAEIQRILEPMAPRGGIVRADDARNIITLAGSRQEIAGMLEAISIFDIDTMKGMSFALVPVRSSQPTAIAEELRTVFAANQRRADGRHGALSSQQPAAGRPGDHARSANTWRVPRIGCASSTRRPRERERQFYTYAVQNRRAQDLVAVLQALFSPESDGKDTRNVAPPIPKRPWKSKAA